VYQGVSDGINFGCSPPGYPTAQYIACNRRKFIVNEDAEGVLIRDKCTSNVQGSAGARRAGGWLAAGMASLLMAALLW
jgi:hypothetical protein